MGLAADTSAVAYEVTVRNSRSGYGDAKTDDLKLFAGATTETLYRHIDETVNIGGIVSQIKRSKIKKGPNEGKLMAKFVLDDQYGSVDVVVFSEPPGEPPGRWVTGFRKAAPAAKVVLLLLSERAVDLPDDGGADAVVDAADGLVELAHAIRRADDAR